MSKSIKGLLIFLSTYMIFIEKVKKIMGLFIKLFDTHSQYESYTADTANFIKPNVSYCKDQANVVHYNPSEPPTPPQQNNVITYTASEQVNPYSSTAFSGESGQLTITSHTFENGIGRIEFDDDITWIGHDAFKECSGLISIIIPNVEVVDYSAFQDCSDLTSVTISSGVTFIGQDVFYGCTAVSDVYCHPNPSSLQWHEVDKDDFKEDGSTRCHVKSEWLSEYQSKFYDLNVTFVGDLF